MGTEVAVHPDISTQPKAQDSGQNARYPRIEPNAMNTAIGRLDNNPPDYPGQNHPNQAHEEEELDVYTDDEGPCCSWFCCKVCCASSDARETVENGKTILNPSFICFLARKLSDCVCEAPEHGTLVT